MHEALVILTSLRTEKLQALRELLKLLGDLIWSDGEDLWGVPKGFISDGPSKPWFTPERGPWEWGSWPHDFGYRFGFLYRMRKESKEWEKVPMSKADLDSLYRDLGLANGMKRSWAKLEREVLRWWPGTLWIWLRYRMRNEPWRGKAPRWRTVGELR